MQFDRPFNRYSINVENSRQSTSWSTEWGNCRAFGWSRHWLVASPASVRRPAAKRTHWTILTWKLQDVTVTLDNNWDSGVFKGGGHGAMPPFWPDHKNFLQANLYQKVRFCRFPARTAKFNDVWWSFFIPIQYAIKITMWDCICIWRANVTERFWKPAASRIYRPIIFRGGRV